MEKSISPLLFYFHIHNTLLHWQIQTINLCTTSDFPIYFIDNRLPVRIYFPSTTTHTCHTHARETVRKFIKIIALVITSIFFIFFATSSSSTINHHYHIQHFEQHFIPHTYFNNNHHHHFSTIILCQRIVEPNSTRKPHQSHSHEKKIIKDNFLTQFSTYIHYSSTFFR